MCFHFDHSLSLTGMWTRYVKKIENMPSFNERTIILNVNGMIDFSQFQPKCRRLGMECMFPV